MKADVRADVITPAGIHVIDYVVEILPMLWEDTLYFKVHHDVFLFLITIFIKNIWN